MKLRNNSILVTGGGSGIGATVSKRFTDGGANVIICGHTVVADGGDNCATL